MRAGPGYFREGLILTAERSSHTPKVGPSEAAFLVRYSILPSSRASAGYPLGTDEAEYELEALENCQ